MKQVSLTLSDTEFDKFMNLLKSFKSAKNVQAKEINADDSILGLTDEHKKIIDQRIAKHLSGESKSHTWEEVKENARNSKL